MSEEFVSLNMSLTGAEEVISALREYIDNLVETGEVQKTTSESADGLSKSIDSLVKPLDSVAKGLADLVKQGSDASKVIKDVSDSNKVAADSAKAAGDAIATQNKALGDNAKVAADAAKANQDFADSEDEMVTPTERQTIALENQTRQLIIQRDAAIAAVKKNQNFAENFAASAPRLTRSAMLITAGMAGLGYEGIKQYMNFNSLMTQTFAQAGVAYSKHKALTRDMGQIAKETGRNFTDVANSLYRVASATASWNNGKGATVSQLDGLVKQVESLQILGNLSTGAQSDQAARIVGSIANTPGMPKDPKQIAAQVNAIVGSGDIRMSELITALGRGVLTSGSTMGLNLKQIGAYVDLLTTRGTTGASAGTYVAHAFQLLAGSTAQARNWQGAIGLQSGQMEETMRKQGLTAAVQLLYQHMQKLAATPYLTVTKGYGVLKGQAAAEYMMEKTGLSPQEIAAWESGNMDAATKAAVMQTEMTSMFGGGRQAMPLMALMQSVTGGKLNGSYQNILASIDKHSTNNVYNKDLSLVQNSPRVQEQKLLRTLQWDLIQFGQAITPIWLGMLKAGIGVLNFFTKFKGYLVELGIVLGSILTLVGAKELTKLALKGRDLFGAARYYSARGIGNREGSEIHFKEGSWASKYANKRGLKYSENWYNQQKQIDAAGIQIKAGEELLAAAGSLKELALIESGQHPGLANSAWNHSQTIGAHPWKVGPENINAMNRFTPSQTKEMMRAEARRRYYAAGGINSGRNISSFEQEVQGEFNKTGGVGNSVMSAATNGSGNSFIDLASMAKNGERTAIATEKAAKIADETASVGGDIGKASGLLGKLGGLGSVAGDAASVAGDVGGLASAGGLAGIAGMLGEGAIGSLLGPLGMALPFIMPMLMPSIMKYMPHVISGAGSLLNGITQSFSSIIGWGSAPGTSVATNMALANAGKATLGGVGFNPNKVDPLLRPKVLNARADFLQKEADAALKQGNFGRFIAYSDLAKKNRQRAYLMGSGKKSAELSIERSEIQDLLNLRKEAANTPGQWRSVGTHGAAVRVNQFNVDGMSFGSTTGIDAELRTLERRTGYILHPPVPRVAHPLLMTAASLNSGGAGITPSMMKHAQQQLLAESIAFHPFNAKKTFGNIGFGGGGIEGVLGSLKHLLSERHSGTTDEKMGRAGTVLIDAALALKASKAEQAKADQDMAKGNYDAAATHKQAAQKLQDASIKLQNAGNTMKSAMHLDAGTMSEFQTAMSAALNDSNMASQIGAAVGSAVNSGIQAGIKTKTARA